MNVEYVVYAKVDKQNRIIAVNSSAFLHDATGWTEIDCGTGEKYYYAQTRYLPKSIIADMDIFRYKLVDGKPQERTQEEMDADYAARPAPPPSDKDRIAALEEQLLAAKILLGVE